MKIQFIIESINISKEKGVAKTPIPEALIQPDGLLEDAHSGNWHRQVSLLGMEQIDSFQGAGRKLLPGEFAENLSTRGLDLRKVALFDRFKIGSAELEVTQIGKECHSGCAIFKEVGSCIMPKEGLFTRVISGGKISAGMSAEFIPIPFKIAVITLSDRASAGEYADRSGPQVVSLLETFFSNRRDHLAVDRIVIPDEDQMLESQYIRLLQENYDLVITTGSTGIGPRDIAPEVTAAFCDKLIPGIMEHIRIKFGAKKSTALLSRGLAGVRDRMMVFNLPGSVRAVEETMQEILPLLTHMRLMLNGVDAH